jgi:hypothetical protein
MSHLPNHFLCLACLQLKFPPGFFPEYFGDLICGLLMNFELCSVSEILLAELVDW